MKVHTKIQRWGNGLALRISGSLREIPQLKDGTEVDVEVTEEGFTLKKSLTHSKKKFPYTENELLKDLSAKKAHADLLTNPLPHEME